jgi:ferredoxin
MLSQSSLNRRHVLPTLVVLAVVVLAVGCGGDVQALGDGGSDGSGRGTDLSDGAVVDTASVAAFDAGQRDGLDDAVDQDSNTCYLQAAEGCPDAAISCPTVEGPCGFYCSCSQGAWGCVPSMCPLHH